MFRTALLTLTTVAMPICLANAGAQAVHSTLTPPSVVQTSAHSAASRGLNAVISVNIEAVLLPQALRTIARQADLAMTFGDRVHQDTRRVTLRRNQVSVAEALREVLKGTGLSYSVAQSGQIVIAKISGEKRVQGVITGKVTDAKTGKGVSGATVSVSNDTRGVTTGEDGSYRLTGIAAGTHTVTVRLVGYAKQTRSVTVGEGATLTVDFTLEPSASVLDQVIVTGTVVATELKAVPSAITVITAKQIEERGITRIDQLFRGEIPGLFAQNMSSDKPDDRVTMFSRGATTIVGNSAGTSDGTNPIKTYVDGVEMANPAYLSQIDPKSIERIEILTGPQASTIYGSNALNGVMQIFTKRGSSSRPQLALSLLSGWVENNYSSARTPQHDYNAQVSGVEGRVSYSGGGSWNYMGPWTPAKQTARRGGFGGVRLEMPAGGGSATADVTLRRTDAKTQVKAGTSQTNTDFGETGWYSISNATSLGLTVPRVITVTGQTFGLTVNYAPTSWWSHEAGIGQDDTDNESRLTGRGYRTVSDTILQLIQNYTERRSLRYATTAQVPVTSLAQATVTLGADAWQNLTTEEHVNGLSSTTGDVSGKEIGFVAAYFGTRNPDHNTGGFLQTQLGIMDRLYFTYGLRAEWNPNFGAEVQPNYTPRYGVAYTHELGALTAKLRGSYGRSTRPPASTLKNSRTLTQEFRKSAIPDYGDADVRLANPELAPEHQQGGEGGLEFYFGSRGSLVVTRYNQTVDALIDIVKVDSVRSLTNTPTAWDVQDADGYGYLYQSQFLNVSSIRNQGWELQGSVNTGPLTTRATYSWTKSRTLGVTPKYRAYFSNAGFYPQYQPGATYGLLPEHTWAIGITYARPQTTVALNVNGIGKVTGVHDEFEIKNLSSRIRLLQNRLNMWGLHYGSNAGYALVDLTASHRFSGRMEGVLQVQNLTDSYTNDLSGSYATIGRQTKAGLRIRM